MFEDVRSDQNLNGKSNKHSIEKKCFKQKI